MSLPMPARKRPIHACGIGGYVGHHIHVFGILIKFLGAKYLWPKCTCRVDLNHFRVEIQIPIWGSWVWFHLFVSVSMQSWKGQNRYHQVEMLGIREYLHHQIGACPVTGHTELLLGEKGQEVKKYFVCIKLRWLILFLCYLIINIQVQEEGRKRINKDVGFSNIKRVESGKGL